ncbi:ABC transporter permease [Bradyrhizobium sp. U87765 SZCCT0131]|uniref:ABC transporter permease n=1 Tax=unclassified Bradyrhizobium TaxID=2631580 RepID=UPI001BAC3474|nr:MULTISPECIES: ABC transporter permease [unclassified Bradyrhizobium]MBR1222792.1 ABC transporter permease [Bradyrhizobium sp. U87765 SZCCT0131]MBR1265127.1 ABC transporter permease [Bradyrhizobium sp. U87765 SZCCT0134]MBR1303094.1 ABC transporter permease [Bradyrhizobium sp. U87765 SZCCT0110]MBR1318700.1 ABC transporter permease [Bradyrhizobium sp. U87765 SZCCT0109]MBR1347023.1 ABC transporter permease [Bradyrhizobium sp. U87765 SZCCT0048]
MASATSPAPGSNGALSAGSVKPAVVAKRGRGLVGRVLRAVLPFVVIAIIWQIASLYTKPYLFPGLGSVAKSFWTILTTWDLLSQGLVTWARLVVAVAASLVIGIPIGLAIGLSRRADEFLRPIVKFIMGVPALNWVIIVIIWFSSTELRIGFVLVVLCTPVTVYCVYDGVRSIDRKLTDMVLAFGANPIQHVRLLLWPYVKASAFTAAKLNVGNAVRTVIVAELVGAPLGIGKELDLAKNVFDMATVLAWTIVLVLMALIMTQGIEVAERVTLRWRGESQGRD